MRVLVTGAAGQLGLDVVRAWTAAGDDVTALDREALDVTDRDAVVRLVGAARPDVVVNCAAWTAVDACEGDPERADAANGRAVQHLAEVCDAVGSRLVQISTDYVFDGTLDRPYREHDATNPQSAYGRSKRAGEVAALAMGDKAVVVRTSWVCGVHGSNMVKTVLRFAAERPELAFVDDQVGHPTFTQDLAPLLRRIVTEGLHGLVHATNQGACSWYDFAREVVAASGRDPSMVRPIATADLQPPRPAPRPANSVLENGALVDADIPLLRHHREAVAETVTALM
ncbi:MAG: dTDP-4-dehydrorhamnose reductase [Acidobacteria bacterium]|nr:dTDP-4-dehydrorhamnose reductase [Acidobacteriota bacterium]